jgi:hypothetical protein
LEVSFVITSAKATTYFPEWEGLRLGDNRTGKEEKKKDEKFHRAFVFRLGL